MAHSFFNIAHAMKALVNKAFFVWLFLANSSILWAVMVLNSPVAAHTYFFAVSDINYNEQSKRIEIIHQFTAHDIENTIAETKQINFSPENPNYDTYIKEYFEQRFSLTAKVVHDETSPDKAKISLTWIGFEVKRGKLYAYQESEQVNSFDEVTVTNTVLTRSFPKQVNTVNYQCVMPKGVEQSTEQSAKNIKKTVPVSSPTLMLASLTFDTNTTTAIISRHCR